MLLNSYIRYKIQITEIKYVKNQNFEKGVIKVLPSTIENVNYKLVYWSLGGICYGAKKKVGFVLRVGDRNQHERRGNARRRWREVW